MNFSKRIFALAVPIISIIILKPSILYFLWSMLLVLVAIALAIPLSLFIASKVINHAVKECPKIKLRQQNTDKENPANIWAYLKHKLRLSLDLFLLSIAQSPVIQNAQAAKQKAAVESTVYEDIKPLGKSPDRVHASQSGMIHVSPNIDQLMLQIFEYTYRDYVELWYIHFFF